MTERRERGAAGRWGRIRRERRARLAALAIAFIALLALIGPLVSPYAIDQLDWQHLAVGPGWASGHLLGTDRLGRDLLVRTLYGARVSLAIGITASLVSVLIGVSWGAIAGYLGARTDALMMRTVDVLNSLPYLFIVIVLTTLMGRGRPSVLFLAIGAVGWLTMARIVRGQVLAIRHREYIEAAITAGAPTPHILVRHVVPNALGPVVAYAALIVPQMILFESFLSFLGLGVQEPLASLGSLIREGAQEMQSAPWLLAAPALLLLALLIGFNLLSDGLRDALDPHED